MKTYEQLSTVLLLNEYQIALPLLKAFNTEELASCCTRLKNNNVSPHLYANCEAIQNELIKDERFIAYLKRLNAANMSKESINKFFEILHKHGESALDYPFERLISSMALTTLYKDVFYDYIKFFSCLTTNKNQKSYIIKNLTIYQKQTSKDIAELTNNERSFFVEPYLCETRYVPQNSIDKAISMFVINHGLQKIFSFLFEMGIQVSFDITHYDNLAASAEFIYSKLIEIFRLLGKDKKIMEKLCQLWKDNDCTLYDLQTLSQRFKGMAKEQIKACLTSRSSYINIIYGSKISKIPFSEISAYQEKILIYAFANKKKGFIKLVEDNYEAFSRLRPQSILFNKGFYTLFVNINSLNAANLTDCAWMVADDMAFAALDEGYTYTFEEIKALYGLPSQYVSLYKKLALPRVDKRLITFKQLTKHKLLSAITDETHLNKLSEALMVKPLSLWREQKFSHIEGLKPLDIVELLIYKDEIERFIPQMRTRVDVRLVLRNWNKIYEYDTIEKMKENITKIDVAWRELSQVMEFNEKFIKQNQERVIDFLCNDGAQISKTYYNGLNNNDQKESLKRIVKAVLMGEFATLKYYADDLTKEIDHPIDKAQKGYWSQNTELTQGKITVKECDDYYGTLQMGTMPQRTCLSYVDGEYKDCLLSNFDSNKKILYAYIDGKVIGRAIVRLTKSRFIMDENVKANASGFNFVDVENLGKHTTQDKNKKPSENLILFLEKPYIAGVSPDDGSKIIRLFVELMEIKATRMGAMFVLSNQYRNWKLKGYTNTLLHVYISRSKAGAQYFDSLNGSATVSDEGGYKSNNFFIRNTDIQNDVVRVHKYSK